MSEVNQSMRANNEYRRGDQTCLWSACRCAWRLVLSMKRLRRMTLPMSVMPSMLTDYQLGVMVVSVPTQVSAECHWSAGDVSLIWPKSNSGKTLARELSINGISKDVSKWERG